MPDVIEGGALDQLLNLPLRDKNPYIQKWKEEGGYVFGYTCSYVPEELLISYQSLAKILPIRMGANGCTTTEDADIYIHKFVCSFPRAMVQCGLNGEYDYLDGIIFTSCCEHMRRCYEVWRDRVGKGKQFMLSVPHDCAREHHFNWYFEEVQNMLNQINHKWGLRTTDERKEEAIKLYNRYRDLMAELYALRALDKPKLTGTEAMKIAEAGNNMPKDVFCDLLEEALEELKQREGFEPEARIMISGSFIDDTNLIECIESTGAIVVTDNLCTARKYIETNIEEGTDNPAETICRRYFNRITCPRTIHGLPARIEFIKGLADYAKVDGIIFEKMSFCDNHGVENLTMTEIFDEIGVPSMRLEREYTSSDYGRFKTRVQAFLEKIS